ncbi:hypothetical protein PINS_up014201 [Pythium insidiosum]|nr:hypothetical protein PINS_up014201 [Pythium insidiosum]
MAKRMPSSIAVFSAAAVGDLDLLCPLLAPGQQSDAELADAAKAAARHGHLDALQSVIHAMRERQEHGCALLVAAIEGGHRDCIEWLLSLGWVHDPVVRLSTQAVERSECETVRWLLTRFPMAVDIGTVFRQAARGHHELLAFIYEELQYEPSETIFEIALSLACQDGALEAVKLLWRHRDRCFGSVTGSLSPFIVDSALRGGHLNVCEYLWEADQQTCIKSSSTVRSAVESGRLYVLQWVLDHVSPTTVASALTAHVCIAAAKAGHLEMLQYLHDDWGIAPESIHALDAAAANGHLNVCKWLLEHSLVGDDREALIGVLLRQLESEAYCSEDEEQQTRGSRQRRAVTVACWLWGRVSPHDWALEPSTTVTRLLAAAACHGVERIVRDLHEQHRSAIASLSPALEAAVEFGRVDVVRYLLQCGATSSTLRPPVPKCLTVCIRYGYMETLALLYESNGTSWSLELLRALESEAASTRHVIIHRWLVGIIERRIQ